MSTDREPTSSDEMLADVQRWLDSKQPAEDPAASSEDSPAADTEEAETLEDQRGHLTLQLEDGTSIEAPTDDAIESAIASLVKRFSFAILLRSPESYMQTSVAHAPRPRRRRRKEAHGLDATEPAIEYLLEYQEDSLENHFEVENGPVPQNVVVAAFLSYARGDSKWQTSVSWTRMDLG